MVKTALLTFSMAGIIGGIAAIVRLISSNHLRISVVNQTLFHSTVTSSTQSGIYNGGFNLELFIFISLIVIASIVSIATIGAIIFLIAIIRKRKKSICIEYDVISEEISQGNVLTHSVDKEVKS